MSHGKIPGVRRRGAVWHLAAFAFSISSEASRSAVAAPVWLRCGLHPATASMSAVQPAPSAAVTARPGAASSAVTVSVWPPAAAPMRSVRLPSAASSRSSRRRRLRRREAIATCPCLAARATAVRPGAPSCRLHVKARPGAVPWIAALTHGPKGLRRHVAGDDVAGDDVASDVPSKAISVQPCVRRSTLAVSV